MSRRNRQDGESPLSLFSFQDIITSLCGIMILLVLLMAIDLAASVDRKLSEAADRRQETKAQQKEAIQGEVKRNVLLREVVALEETFRDSMRSEAERLEAEQAEQARLTSQLGRLQAERMRLESQQAKLAQALRQTVRDTAADEAEILHYQTVPIAFIEDRASTKRAVLVECSEQGIAVARPGTEMPLGAWDIAESAAGLSGVMDSMNPAIDYFVFLIKPSGVRIFRLLSASVQNRRFDIGYDVFDERETIARRRP